MEMTFFTFKIEKNTSRFCYFKIIIVVIKVNIRLIKVISLPYELHQLLWLYKWDCFHEKRDLIFKCQNVLRVYGTYIPNRKVELDICRKFWTFRWTKVKKNLLFLERFFFQAVKNYFLNKKMWFFSILSWI